MLKVSASWHGNTLMGLGLGAKRIEVILELALDEISGIQQEGTNQSGNLIISASTRTNLACNICSRNLDEAALQGCVNILFTLIWGKRPRLNRLGQLGDCLP